MRAGAAPRFVTPAVTVSRSCPENVVRASVMDGTETFGDEAAPTGTVVAVVPFAHHTFRTRK